jgi:protein-disulfide isomerase
MSSILKFLRLTLITCLTVVLSFSLSSCNSSSNAQTNISDADLEKKILEVIRKNPEVILESVQSFQQNQQKRQSDLRSQVLDQVKAKPDLVIRNSPVIGAPSRKIVLAEFSDFQCPYCANAHTNIKQFMEKHKGEVTLTYKHFPLSEIHSHALPAAKAAWAANKQGKFWQYHDALFEGQKNLGEPFFVKIAQDLSLDLAKFNQDRASKEAGDEIEKDIELAKSLGIDGTPYFVFNGNTFSGSPSVTDLEKALAKLQAQG